MIKELISDKCWFCDKKFKVNEYNDTFKCRNHDLVVSLQVYPDGDYGVSFINKYNKVSWAWYADLNTDDRSDLDIAYLYIGKQSHKIKLPILELINKPWEEVYSQLKTLELYL
jgi:hypothetical protein